MKKLVLILTIISAIYQINYAQEVGIRLGNNSTSGSLALDFVWKFETENTLAKDVSESRIKILQILKPKRIHANLTYQYETFIADATGHYFFAPLLCKNLYYYAGPGVIIQLASGDSSVGITGEAGLEYRFAKIPVALGADWNPSLSFTSDGRVIDIIPLGFNIRYVF